MIAPDIEKFDPHAQFNLDDVHYSAPAEFVAAFQNTLGEMATQQIVNDFVPKKNPFFEIGNFPSDAPRTTKDDVDTLTKDRPGLEIPIGIHPKVADLLAKRYDDQQNFGFIAEHPEGLLGKMAAFGGSTAASLMDLKSLAVGGVGGKVAGALAKPLASTLMEGMAAKEIVGSEAAKVGTRVLQTSAEGAGGLGGYQASTEANVQDERERLGQESTYIDSLQNVAKATGLGAILAPAAEFVLKPAFDHIKPHVKEAIGKYYKPWSQDADITAREDAVGQGYNGQEPDVSLTLRQGQIDESENFRNIIKENDIDPSELDAQLARAQENITAEMLGEEKFDKPMQNRMAAFEKINIVKDKRQKDRIDIQSDFGRMELRERDDSLGVVDAGLFSRTGRGENIGKGYGKNLYRSAIDYAESNGKKFTSDFKVSPEAMRVYDSLQKEGYIFKRNSTTYLKEASSKYKGGPVEREHYATTDGKPVFELISSPEKNVRYAVEKSKNLQSLAQQYQLAQSIRDHLNDAHKPLTHDEMKSYGDRLKTIDIPDSGMEIAPAEDASLEKHLEQFDKDQINSLLDGTALEDLKKELEETQRKLDSQPTFAKMTMDIANCIMRSLI